MRIQSDYIEYVPATPEDVLRVFRNRQGLWSRKTEFADRLEGLTLCGDLTDATRLEDWPPFADLDSDLDDFGEALNEFFEINRDPEEWRAVLSPVEKCSLGDVCRFVAETALLPRIKPACFVGVECRPAGAFLAILGLLQSRELDVSNIAPSTVISDYAVQHWKVFTEVLTEIVKFDTVEGTPLSVIWSDKAISFFGFTFISFLLTFLLAMNPDIDLVSGLFAMLTLALLMCGIVASLLPPRTIRLGNLVTFRDLAVRLAGQNS